MIKVQHKGATTANVTFSLPLSEAPEPVSVAGDFNDWDPLAHPLKKRSNGMRSVVVSVPVPSTIEFKYLAHGGLWFNDPDASRFDVNPHNETNSVLVLDAPTVSAKAAADR